VTETLIIEANKPKTDHKITTQATKIGLLHLYTRSDEWLIIGQLFVWWVVRQQFS